MHSTTTRTHRHEHRPLHAAATIGTTPGQHHGCTMSGANLEPAGYAELLDRLKVQVRTAQAQAKRAANTALLELYWTIGSEIIGQQQQQGWGAKVVDRLAGDLRAEFPDMRGLNRSNLYARLVNESAGNDGRNSRSGHPAGSFCVWCRADVAPALGQDAVGSRRAPSSGLQGR